MKDYVKEKKVSESKPKKLHECGHVSREENQWERCNVLTSRSFKLDNGNRVYLCSTHAKEHEPKK
jgi:hypothetical protein